MRQHHLTFSPSTGKYGILLQSLEGDIFVSLDALEKWSNGVLIHLDEKTEDALTAAGYGEHFGEVFESTSEGDEAIAIIKREHKRMILDNSGVAESKVTYGISITENGKTEYREWDDYNSAESAQYDFARDLPDAEVKLVSRLEVYSAWAPFTPKYLL